MNVEGFGCITQNLCFTTGVSKLSIGMGTEMSAETGDGNQDRKKMGNLMPPPR